MEEQICFSHNTRCPSRRGILLIGEKPTLFSGKKYRHMCSSLKRDSQARRYCFRGREGSHFLKVFFSQIIEEKVFFLGRQGDRRRESPLLQKTGCSSRRREAALHVEERLNFLQKRDWCSRWTETDILVEERLIFSQKRACSSRMRDTAFLVEVILIFSQKRPCPSRRRETALLVEEKMLFSSKRCCFSRISCSSLVDRGCSSTRLKKAALLPVLERLLFSQKRRCSSLRRKLLFSSKRGCSSCRRE